MEPINVIFTGLVRDQELFVKSIKDLAELRHENMVDEIIFSTWIGEIDKYDGLRNALEVYDCHLVEGDPPPRSQSNIWHQMKSLYLGLELIKGNSYCLKTRADLFIKPEFIRKLISDKDYLNISLQDDHNPIFEKKVWIPYFEITKPFYMSDECFFGKTIDIKKLVNFDASYDVLYNIDCGITHIRRFIHPFVQKNTFLKQYLRYAAYSGHFTPFRFEILEYNLKSDFYLRCLAIYYQILHTYFRVESDYTPEQFIFRHECINPTVALDEKEFRSNFAPKKSWNVKDGHIYAYNEAWLDNLFNRSMYSDDSLSRLYGYLDDPARHSPELQDEINAYRSFMEKCTRYKDNAKTEQEETSLLGRIRRRFIAKLKLSLH